MRNRTERWNERMEMKREFEKEPLRELAGKKERWRKSGIKDEGRARRVGLGITGAEEGESLRVEKGNPGLAL